MFNQFEGRYKMKLFKIIVYGTSNGTQKEYTLLCVAKTKLDTIKQVHQMCERMQLRKCITIYCAQIADVSKECCMIENVEYLS